MRNRLDRRRVAMVGTAGASSARLAGLLSAVLLLAAANEAHAQAWNYPTFQQSHIVEREFNFAVADGGSEGTSFLFQWREQVGQPSEIVVDAGFAGSKNGSSTIGFFGGQYDYQLVAQADSQQIEVLATGGLNFAFGDGTIWRIPVGVSAGHRFPLGSGLAVTPYITPRIALETCDICGTNGSGRTALGIGFGLGANLEVTPNIAVRFDTSFGFSSIAASDNAFGFGVAWSPAGLRKK